MQLRSRRVFQSVGKFMAAVCLLLVPGSLWAGTTGVLTGKITGGEDNPVVAATVLLIGTRLGAYSDAEGNFTILNIPAGTYSVKVSRLGYNSVTTEKVRISADNTTTLDVGLGTPPCRPKKWWWWPSGRRWT